MDDSCCPHCRSGSLESGTCTECGWSIAIARPVRPRPLSREEIIASVPSRACWFVLPCAAVFINLLGPIMYFGPDYVFFGSMTSGAVAAQFGLLAIIGAVGPGRHAVRLVATFAIAAALLLVLIVGIASTARGGPSARGLGGTFLVLPAVLLAAQAPLWVFRGLTGRWMRATAGSSVAALQRRAQFGVAQLMWATALIAVVIALARGGLVVLGQGQKSDRAPALEWAGLATACGGVALASGIIAVPATATVMIPRSPGGAVVLLLVYAVMLTMAMLGIITAVAGPAPAEEVAMLGLTSLATFGGILAGLGVIRQCGYSMVRGGPRRIEVGKRRGGESGTAETGNR